MLNKNRLNRIEAFDVVNYILLIFVSLIMVYPFLNVVAISFSSYSAYVENPTRIWPKDFSVIAYSTMLRHPRLWSSYLNTIIITLSTVVISLILYILTAYPLSKKHLKGRGFIMKVIVFTMLFNGGLIPNYYLISRLHLIDTLTAIIVTSLMSSFNIILMKNFFESIPESLEEAAKIDGASELFVLVKIVIPLSMPIIATISLFTAVGCWNNFMSAVIYIRSSKKWPLMLFLREILMGAKMEEMFSGGNLAETSKDLHTETMQYATLMIVMLPIICIYPFLQKYFVKGIMVVSVKG